MNPINPGQNRLTGIVVGLVLTVGVTLGIGFFMTRGPDASSLPDEVAAALAELKTVQGRLVLGKGDQVLEYELWVERPRHLRAEAELQGLDRKAVFILMFNENEAWTYDPVLQVATVTDRTKAPPTEGLRVGTSLLETMSDDVLAALHSGDVQIIGDEPIAGRDALRVQVLLPLAQEPFDSRQLTVWLDKTTYYPLAIEGDTGFRMRFDFVKFNQDIDPLPFVFLPPPGAHVRPIGE